VFPRRKKGDWNHEGTLEEHITIGRLSKLRGGKERISYNGSKLVGGGGVESMNFSLGKGLRTKMEKAGDGYGLQIARRGGSGGGSEGGVPICRKKKTSWGGGSSRVQLKKGGEKKKGE